MQELEKVYIGPNINCGLYDKSNVRGLEEVDEEVLDLRNVLDSVPN